VTHVEVTHQSWFERIRDSLQGIVFGLLLFVISFPLLFWNEGRAVHRAQSLTEGKGAVVEADATKLDPKLNGKLVHFTAEATTEETLRDAVFPEVEAPHALRLKRTVEMYQWKQNSSSKKRKKLGGGEETVTTYTYEKVWSDRAISSSGFKEPGHSNPGGLPLNSAEETSKAGTVGVYKLGSLVSRLGNWETVGAPEEAERDDYAVSGGTLYRGADPSHPEVGDVRVTFAVVRPATVSAIAVQDGQNLSPYTARAGGSSIYELRLGEHSAKNMFTALESSNAVMTWVLRFVGFFLMAGGLSTMMRPLSVLADVIPFVGDLVGFGTGLIAVGIAAPLSLLTIAAGWIVYRPVMGLALLLLAAGTVLLGFKAWKGRAPRQ